MSIRIKTDRYLPIILIRSVASGSYFSCIGGGEFSSFRGLKKEKVIVMHFIFNAFILIKARLVAN